jgi:hypothetical protein
MVRDADAFLADMGKLTDPLDPDVLQLRDEVRGLRSSVANVLAVAGLDPSWVRTPQHIDLGPADSAFVADLLQNTREPSNTLRRAAEDYKSFVDL